MNDWFWGHRFSADELAHLTQLGPWEHLAQRSLHHCFEALEVLQLQQEWADA